MNHESKNKSSNDVKEENIPKLQELITGINNLSLSKDATAKTATELYEIQDRISKSIPKLSALKNSNANFINYYNALKHRLSERGYKNFVTCFEKGIIETQDEVTEFIVENVIRNTTDTYLAHISQVNNNRPDEYKKSSMQILAMLRENCLDLILTEEAAKAKFAALKLGNQKGDLIRYINQVFIVMDSLKWNNIRLEENVIAGTLFLNLDENYSEFSDDINRRAANDETYDPYKLFDSIGDYEDKLGRYHKGMIRKAVFMKDRSVGTYNKAYRSRTYNHGKTEKIYQESETHNTTSDGNYQARHSHN